MVGKLSPALKSCTLQSCKPSNGEVNNSGSQLPGGILSSSAVQKDTASGCELDDRLSRIPDDVLLSLLSSFTLKEVARIGVLSHRWKYLWRCFPVLKFEDRKAVDKILDSILKFADRSAIDKIYDINEVRQERSSFVRRVDHIVDQHLASSIDELRVTFDLDDRFQDHVDKWVVFALTKQVKTLELDFSPEVRILNKDRYCTLPLNLPHYLADVKHSLRSLCLKFLKVTTEQIECLLFSCLCLEDLCIEASEYITSLNVSGPSLQLKHLEIDRCNNVKAIDISAPKLMSFTYYGHPIELHVISAPSLSEVLIGGLQHDLIDYAFNPLWCHFSQLEYLTLHMYTYHELNLGISHAPALTNLRHLELHVVGMSNQSLLGWTPLIEASPVLEKLSFKMQCDDIPSRRVIIGHSGRPLKCLKTLELVGFLGRKIDIELATYVFKNAVMLEEVVVDFEPLYPYLGRSDDAQERVVVLEEGLPRGAKLTIK